MTPTDEERARYFEGTLLPQAVESIRAYLLDPDPAPDVRSLIRNGRRIADVVRAIAPDPRSAGLALLLVSDQILANARHQTQTNADPGGFTVTHTDGWGRAVGHLLNAQGFAGAFLILESEPA